MLVFDFDNDFERIFSFLKENGDEFIPSLSNRVVIDKYAKKLADHGNNLFVRADDVDIGHAAFYVNDKQNGIAFLSSICVVKQQQGFDVATGLLKKVITGAVREGMIVLQLEVHIDNYRAIAFYRKHGFKISFRPPPLQLINEEKIGWLK